MSDEPTDPIADAVRTFENAVAAMTGTMKERDKMWAVTLSRMINLLDNQEYAELRKVLVILHHHYDNAD